MIKSDQSLFWDGVRFGADGWTDETQNAPDFAAVTMAMSLVIVWLAGGLVESSVYFVAMVQSCLSRSRILNVEKYGHSHLRVTQFPLRFSLVLFFSVQFSAQGVLHKKIIAVLG